MSELCPGPPPPPLMEWEEELGGGVTPPGCICVHVPRGSCICAVYKLLNDPYKSHFMRHEADKQPATHGPWHGVNSWKGRIRWESLHPSPNHKRSAQSKRRLIFMNIDGLVVFLGEKRSQN